MIEVVALDSGPLGMLTNPARTRQVIEINLWVEAQVESGVQVVVPSVAAFEVRRELIRSGKAAGLARLDSFLASASGRLLPLSNGVLELAAELWAKARQQGRLTADPRELDCDVLIAAQVIRLGLGDSVVIATTNVGHLSQFVAAELWSDLPPLKPAATG